MADQREIALNHLQLHGPSLPIQVSKALNTNILFASAVLSELASNKKILISHAAIGGSKVYYLKGQETKLGEKIYPSLKGKEKQAYELLQEKKVLRDIELEPWQRIALRELKDFAMPLTVSLGTEAELFWKFHVLTDEDAKPFIQEYIVPAETKSEPVKPETPQKTAEEQQIELEKVKQHLREELLKELQQEFKAKEETRQEEIRLKEQKETPLKKTQEELEEEEIEEIEEIKPLKKKETVQETIVEIKPKKPEGKFYSKIREYLDSNKIDILKEEMIKKEKEFDFIVRFPSVLGHLTYYVKAKDKAAINEADISLAHSEGQVKKLPCILLATGKMNKKASLLVEQKLAGQVVFKEL